MYKLFVIAISVGGVILASSESNSVQSDNKSNSVKKQYCWAADTSEEDNKLERRKRGKGHKGRRRGGAGLR